MARQSADQMRWLRLALLCWWAKKKMMKKWKYIKFILPSPSIATIFFLSLSESHMYILLVHTWAQAHKHRAERTKMSKTSNCCWKFAKKIEKLERNALVNSPVPQPVYLSNWCAIREHHAVVCVYVRVKIERKRKHTRFKNRIFHSFSSTYAHELWNHFKF